MKSEREIEELRFLKKLFMIKLSYIKSMIPLHNVKHEDSLLYETVGHCSPQGFRERRSLEVELGSRLPVR